MATTASKSSRRRSRYGQARRDSSNSSASPMAAASSAAHSATSCCASTSSGASCDDDRVELAAPDRPDQRGALHQVVARFRKHAPLRQAGNRVTRPPHALDERRDPVRRSDLAHQIHAADVDAELERGRCHEHPQLAALEAGFGVEPRFLRQAPVVRGHRLVAEPLAEVPGQALRHLARVHEDDGGAVLAGELGEAVVVLAPDLVGHDGVELRARNLERQVHRPAVPLVDDGARSAAGARQPARHLLDRLLRRRKADAQQRLLRHARQALERQRQMRPAARADDGVDLVDDHRPHRAQHLAAARRRQEQVERLGRRDQDVRRRLHHRRALGGAWCRRCAPPR